MDRLDLHTEVTQHLDDAVGIGLLLGIIHDQTLVLITSEEIEGGVLIFCPRLLRVDGGTQIYLSIYPFGIGILFFFASLYVQRNDIIFDFLRGIADSKRLHLFDYYLFLLLALHLIGSEIDDFGLFFLLVTGYGDKRSVALFLFVGSRFLLIIGNDELHLLQIA